MLMKITIRKTNCTIKYGNNNCICHLQLRDDQLKDDQLKDDQLKDDQLKDDLLKDDQLKDDQLRDDLLLWKQVVPHIS